WEFSGSIAEKTRVSRGAAPRLYGRRDFLRTRAQVVDHGGLLAAHLDARALALALVGVHRVVVLMEQRRDPDAVFVETLAARLFRQRRFHHLRQALITFVAEAFDDIAQAFAQALREQRRALLGPVA